MYSAGMNAASTTATMYIMLYLCSNYFRLQAEVEEILEGRTEVTSEDLEKLQYTEQVVWGI